MLTKAEVAQPITIRAIERKRHDADGPWAAVRVRLECAVMLDCGEANAGLLKAFDRQDDGNVTAIERVTGAAVLESYPNLAFRDADESLGIYSEMLERFIKLGTTRDASAEIDDLGDDPEQGPVVLRSGALAELLQAGILTASLIVDLELIAGQLEGTLPHFPGVGRNPATGEQIKIPARTRLRFTPAKALKDEVLGAR